MGEGAWRCLNCDAILSEGDDLGPVLNQHRNQDCRHPESRSRAATRESKCVGCCAALAQVRARIDWGHGARFEVQPAILGVAEAAV